MKNLLLLIATSVAFTGSTSTAHEINVTPIGVGIGTSTPGYQLNTSKVANVSDLGQLVRFTNASVANGLGPFHMTIGTANYWAQNPSPVICGTNGLALGVGDGSNFTDQRKLIISPSGNVGIGTATPTQKLDVAGSVRATSFITPVRTYADYVFSPEYILPTLNEVEAHIKEHQHLPGIPSEKEAVANDINLGDMQVRLLAQVEQLTLHMIALNKQMEAQKDQIESQREKIKVLEALAGGVR